MEIGSWVSLKKEKKGLLDRMGPPSPASLEGRILWNFCYFISFSYCGRFLLLLYFFPIIGKMSPL